MSTQYLTWSARQEKRTYTKETKKMDEKALKIHYVHSAQKDDKGKPAKYVRVYLPDKDHRTFQFTESYGFDRNRLYETGTRINERGDVEPKTVDPRININERKAYIQVAQDAIKAVLNKETGKPTLTHFIKIVNAEEHCGFVVYFESEPERNAQGNMIYNQRGTRIFDVPGKVRLSVEELKECFPNRSREKVRNPNLAISSTDPAQTQEQSISQQQTQVQSTPANEQPVRKSGEAR